MSDHPTYPMGSTIVFTAVALDVKAHKRGGKDGLDPDQSVMSEGLVNGEPLDANEDGVITHVPVFVVSTGKNLMVAVKNIVSVEKPERLRE